jgi:hypothetical protein
MTIGRVVFGPTDRDDAIARLTRERNELTDLRLQVVSLTRQCEILRLNVKEEQDEALRETARADAAEAERDRLRAVLHTAYEFVQVADAPNVDQVLAEIDAALKEQP